MAVITVGDSASLRQALQFAKPGDTIALQAGTYTPLKLSGFNFSAAVTITSADPSHPAVLTGLTVAKSANLAFSNLTFSTLNAASNFPFSVTNSADITLSHLNVHGDPTQEQSATVTGLLVRYSTNVTVSDSRFHGLFVGLAHSMDNGLTIENNNFHDLQIRGIDGGGSNNVTIAGNLIHDINWVPGDLHPEAIQFWTNAQTPQGNNITITGNTIWRGDGACVQGIFMGADLHTGGQPFNNVTIQDNKLYGMSNNGMIITNANNLNISNNLVASYSDFLSRIVLNGVDGATLDGNAVWRFSLTNVTNLSQLNNIAIGASQSPNTDPVPILPNLPNITGAQAPDASRLAQAMAALNPTAAASASPATHLAHPAILAQLTAGRSHAAFA